MSIFKAYDIRGVVPDQLGAARCASPRARRRRGTSGRAGSWWGGTRGSSSPELAEALIARHPRGGRRRHRHRAGRDADALLRGRGSCGRRRRDGHRLAQSRAIQRLQDLPRARHPGRGGQRPAGDRKARGRNRKRAAWRRASGRSGSADVTARLRRARVERGRAATRAAGGDRLRQRHGRRRARAAAAAAAAAGRAALLRARLHLSEPPGGSAARREPRRPRRAVRAQRRRLRRGLRRRRRSRDLRRRAWRARRLRSGHGPARALAAAARAGLRACSTTCARAGPRRRRFAPPAASPRCVALGTPS